MGKTRDILTPKQKHYARCVASGMSQSDAYREAYDVGETTKPSTVHEKASLLMAQDKIRARVDTLVAVREKALIRSTVDTRTKVLHQLEQFMESATPQDSVKLRATELLGKSIGLFKDVVETPSNDNRSSEELKEELRALIESFAEVSEGHTVN
jgi:hypothetical protein